jgi:hypothetical protein
VVAFSALKLFGFKELVMHNSGRHVAKDSSLTNMGSEFILLLIKTLPSSSVFTDCSCRQSGYIYQYAVTKSSVFASGGRHDS